ncbi:hypothetical protein TTHERM_00444790 (macronuclear) [Tetrahymena thermophila SB210]|uniref:Uncharacterized protein n=1 Tax=Tetrahymena thermophila (strain SB210) TaxID=312017 RepID=I7LWY6_TETTS|nr:hypothetical protein TTHERM_00444790 [Tetrahymena thermophila SB210]EAS03097.2 hypothetical protein TTHERM_00444790 [Tetrahymena thermophila SB210]|eukprot:XP_001023342.2 hypothetical protein TTHERM_00444790 [Tetrahymena thermophila SB210]
MDDKKQNYLNEDTKDYSFKHQNNNQKSFEEEYEEYGQCFSDCEQFCLDSQIQKSSQLKNMITNLIVDSDNFQYLKLKGLDQATLTIIEFNNIFQEQVQQFLDQINTIIAEEVDIFTEYVHFEVIRDKQDKISCSLYMIKCLDIQAIKCFSIIKVEEIIQFIKHILQIFSKYEILKRFINNLALPNFIYIQPNGQLKFDYLYFFLEQFNRNFHQHTQKSCEIEELIDFDIYNLQEFNTQNKNTSQFNIEVLIYEYFQKKNSNTTQRDKSFSLITSSSNQQQMSTIDDSTFLAQISRQENYQLEPKCIFLEQDNFKSEFIPDLSDFTQISQQSPPQHIQYCQNTIKKLIYIEGVKNIDKIVKSYNNKQNYSQYQTQHGKQQKQQNTSKLNINQKVYLSLIRIAKKVFYKNILKSSQMYYEDSPFYYQTLMNIKQELEQEGEQFINKKKYESYANREPFWNLNRDEQTNILGNVLNIQLSLKDYITKSIMENPIRFAECVRHTECFDYSTLSYLQKLGKCPECFQYIKNFYEDKYLKFIIQFLSRQNTKQNNSISTQQKTDCYFPYFIQSVNCYSNNGIFIPIIEYINISTTPQDNSLEISNLYPITNFIDLEYLYQIIKYNTNEKTQQMLCQYQFFTQREDSFARQLILSIVNFNIYGNKFQFRLNKVFNENSFLEYPIRNSNYSCTHVDCFDISDLFLINQVQNFQDNNLICPVCKNSIKVEDLVYDKEYKNVINFVEQMLLQKLEKSNEEYIIQKKHYSATIDFTNDIVTYLDDEMQQQKIRIQCLQSNFQEYKKIVQFSSINQSQIFYYDQEDHLQDQEIWEQLYEESKHIHNNSFNDS